MKKLDRYIVGKFLTTFFFAIMILAVISCVIDYSEKVDNIVSKKAPLGVVVNYYKNFVPHITALLFPLFIFIATIFFTSKMAYKSEIIAILSSGVSFRRFLRPYVIGGGFLCLVSLVANHWIIPVANKQRIDFENTYINDANFRYAANDMHLGIAKGTYVYLQNFNFTNYMGNRFCVERIEGTLLKEKIMAEYAIYDTVKKTWELHNVMIRTNDSLHEKLVKLPMMEVKYPFSPRDLNKGDAIKEALTTPQLVAYLEAEQLRGQENLNTYLIEKERRTSQPFAGFVLTMIGACIASRKIRGGSGFHLALGIALSAIYIMFQQISNTFATKASLEPLIAVWIPNVIFGVVAYVLYRRQLR
ncbi:LptF/LptG family permease [Nemorincola caseinilytica]|uniref:LptF/LptG family permease n=1 Tax=Nemorincola caseinilytica TaxID=2054315 RepID=A0ABP8N5J0_9BACT